MLNETVSKMDQKGKIGVTTENIFPVIKQFLYSDHEIFLRELVANAVDATQKMKAVAAGGDFAGDVGDLKVRVELDEQAKTLRIIDNGIGMTADEVDRYINQIAFSSAGEFLEKYKDQNIIGHFGLGFYSAFMVAEKVTVESLSWKEGAEGVLWSCSGDPEYTMAPCDKTDRGTVVTLYLDEDAARDYGTRGKISQLLGKYCKFMPVPIVFGKEQEWKDGKYVDTDRDHVVNGIEPLWSRKPSTLKEEDYRKFYRDLYPMKDEPLFHIHLNVDYPFNLTGILYFPKIRERMAIEKNNIQLYCNQMFVTDHVEAIVPEFLTLLHGVIDSPDIPLNVSRSYLQADENVKKISTYITRKVADRLEEIFKTDRAAWEEKWDNIKLFIEYGMLSDGKFCERAMKFALLKNTEGKFFSLEDYRKGIEPAQKDKEGKVVYLYATDAQAQYPFIEAARNKGYDVLLMDCELDAHFVNLLEQKLPDARFARVDSDAVDNLVVKEERVKPELSEQDAADLETLLKAVLPEGNEYQVKGDNLGEAGVPVLITQNEFMRRYREMSALGGGMDFYGEMPDAYDITVNLEHPVVASVVAAQRAAAGDLADKEQRKEAVEAFAKGSDVLHQLVDLALLSNGMLKGKALSAFILRSQEVLKAAGGK